MQQLPDCRRDGYEEISQHFPAPRRVIGKIRIPIAAPSPLSIEERGRFGSALLPPLRILQISKFFQLKECAESCRRCVESRYEESAYLPGLLRLSDTVP